MLPVVTETKIKSYFKGLSPEEKERYIFSASRGLKDERNVRKVREVELRDISGLREEN